MMRNAFACAAAAAALLSAPAVLAQDGPDVSYNAGVVSDYVFRGFSQTGEDPAIQGGIDITAGSLYGGVWASTVDFGDTTDAEVDFYGGYRTELGGFNVDVGGIVYLYVNAPALTDYHFVEIKAAASRAIGPVTLGAAVFWSPDFYGVDEKATYLEGTAAFTPAEKWTVSGAVGNQWLDVSDDYTTWNAGVGYAATDNISIDVRYYDTDVDGQLSEDRYVVGVKFVY